jgi:phospholipid/cholesterol/gamma-HCH transport system substrate-binding protein
METRANYVLIGVFTLAVVVGVFGFVYWFQNIGGTGERAFYRVVFDGSVSGLRTGASVLFNGIRVGEVTDLKLNPEHPKQVVASISIDKKVAVRKDTEIGLEFQGLTGISALSLKGGDPTKPPLAGAKDAKDDTAPVLIAPPGATQDVTAAARDALKKVQDLIEENQKSIKSALDNIDKFSATLVRNSEHIDNSLASIDKFTGALGRNADRIDNIMVGLETLSGGKDGKSGEINEAARSIKKLADNLDKRTEELTVYIGRLAKTGTRTLSTIDKAAKNFDADPSRIIWGGSPPDQKKDPKKK